MLRLQSGQPQQVLKPEMNSVNQGNLFPNNIGQTQGNLGVAPYNNGNPINTAVHENISVGASASSGDPNQRYGWYLGGMARGDYSTFRYPLTDNNVVASSTFYEVDMSTSTLSASFTPLTWPTDQDARAEGALVWLPFGKAGVLVAFGGVITPADIFSSKPAALPNNNTFMSDLMIYDIDAKQWYSQSTLETGIKPPQLAKFCTTVVPTKDGNSQEIFVYGGYDGSGNRSPPENDDVWVLSVPAFQWTQVSSAAADSKHGRSGPVCFSPNPTTLISIGGSLWQGSSLLSDTIIDVFNLTSLKWDGVYDPSSEAQFTAPDAIVSQLGWPNADGPGSVKVGAVSDSSVNALFSTVYPTQIKPSYPYANASSTSTPEIQPAPSSNKWKIPVIAVLCSVIPLLIIAIVVWCCIKKRRQDKQNKTRTQRTRRNIFSWFEKDETYPITDKSNSSGDTAVESNQGYFKGQIPQTYEVEGASNPTSPGWPSHGVPSPGLSAAMASSHTNERFEIMSQEAKRESPYKNHPYYPRSIDGDHILDVRSQGDSVSYPSGSLPPNHRFSQSQTSPSELPHDRSHEHLPLPENDLALGEPRQEATKKASNKSLGVGAEQFYSPVESIPPSPIIRKPVNTTSIDAELSQQRPMHNRNQSSVSSHIPFLPSPTAEEDHRRSQRIESLPDSPSTPPHVPAKKSSGPLKSAYRENLDEDEDEKR